MTTYVRMKNHGIPVPRYDHHYFDVWVVLWSRSETASREVRGVYTSQRQAENAIKQSIEYDGGWFHIQQYEPLGDSITRSKP